jgi:hypothetical protein
MSNRTAKFASAIFVSCLAGTLLATTSSGAAPAAEECLSGPKAQTPHGAHWYYRIDHATKRHCWYLGEEGGKVVHVARPTPVQPATPVAQEAEAEMQPSIANAHAELPAQPTIEQPNRDDTPAPAMPANAGDAGAMAGALTPSSLVASRWPDPSDPGPPPSPTPDKRDPGTSASSTARTQPPIPTAGPIAAADLSSQASTYSVPMQLAALMGALALAGIMVRVIFKFGSPRRPTAATARARRDAIWENANTDARTRSPYPRAEARGRRPDVSRTPYEAGDGDDRIAEFFAQLSRRTPT